MKRQILRRSLAEKLKYYDFGETKLLLRMMREVEEIIGRKITVEKWNML
jgi:hypothetical protein